MGTTEESTCSDETVDVGKENEGVAPEGRFWRQRRYFVAFLAFFGFFNVYSLRVNLSIAIVAMTELKNITLANGTIVQEREFDWDTKLQGYILSSFFYGYITTQIIGGYCASRVGGKRVFGSGIAVTAALTLITPWLANWNVYLLLAVRIIEGTIGLIWYLIWMLVVADSPSQDSRISKEELEYINNSLRNLDSNKRGKFPWSEVVTSLPVWAITVSHFSENWGFYTLLTQLPKFMKNVLAFDLTNTGFMSALPYLAMAIMIQFSGQLADWTQVKGYFTTTQARRVFNCGGFIAQTVFMLCAAFWLSAIGTTFSLTMAVGLGAFAWAGFSINHLDIAPQHASVLMGFSNTFATVPGILSPILSGYIVTDETSISEWRVVFYISSAIYLFGAIFYGLFASGELQPWAIESRPLKGDETSDGNCKISAYVSYENESFEPDSK